jgi:hypothetical protein
MLHLLAGNLPSIRRTGSLPPTSQGDTAYAKAAADRLRSPPHPSDTQLRRDFLKPDTKYFLTLNIFPRSETEGLLIESVGRNHSEKPLRPRRRGHLPLAAYHAMRRSVAPQKRSPAVRVVSRMLAAAQDRCAIYPRNQPWWFYFIRQIEPSGWHPHPPCPRLAQLARAVAPYGRRKSPEALTQRTGQSM